MQSCALCILALLRVYLFDCVFVYVCVCLYTCVQASVILCGQCVGTWRLLAARCRLPAWDLWSVWSKCCGEFDVVRVAGASAWSERHVIQYSWCGRTCLKCAQLRRIETWTNMLYWEDLARVLELRAIHCLRCGRRRTRVSRVCFKRRGSVSSVAPKQLPLVQGSDQFLFIVPSFSVVKKFLKVAKFAAQSLWHYVNYILPSPWFNQFCPMFLFVQIWCMKHQF